MGLTYQMELILNITSYHRLSPEIEATKTVKDSLIFGRSEACDWHFPDPEKIISSKHGRIVKEGDSFYVYDTSTNGTFVNFGVAPLGQGNKQRLSNSDTITVGDFQIEVKLATNEKTPDTDYGNLSAAASISKEPERSYQHPTEHFSEPEQYFNESIMDESMPAVSMTQASDLNSANQIPENWDELAHLMNPEAVTQQAPVVSKPQQKPAVEQQTSVNTPVLDTPVTKPQAVKPVHKPVVQKNPTSLSEDTALTDVFLNGLGVKAELQNSLNSQELWFEMGQGLNLLLTELMESLRQRALVKNQLRLNQTMFQTQQNNPIKFSADIDDVIQNLFIRNSASFLSSQESIKESFVDTRRHEHALLAGADGVLKGMLEQVSPQHINQQINDNSNVLKIIPGQTEAKCWKLYKNLYDELSHDVNSKGAMALSDDFLKAYNDRIKESF